MTDYLMQQMSDYGLVVLSLSIIFSCMALPLPSTILLVLCGAFIGSGDMQMSGVWTIGFLSAVIGDQMAYGLGTFGGNALENRLGRSPKNAASFAKAKAFSAKWGGLGVFLSRWLVAPIGPWINYASGIGDYHWRGFTFWSIMGELVWVSLYVMLGLTFSDNALTLVDLLGDASWLLLGILAMFLLGKHLIKLASKPMKRRR